MLEINYKEKLFDLVNKIGKLKSQPTEENEFFYKTICKLVLTIRAFKSLI